MSVAATIILALSWPILLVIGLLMLAAGRDHRREARVARQIWVTDAIADELGQIVAPVVTKPLAGPWRVAIQVPVSRPATVSRIVAIVDDTLARTDAGRYELVLSPQPAPANAQEEVRVPRRGARAAGASAATVPECAWRHLSDREARPHGKARSAGTRSR